MSSLPPQPAGATPADVAAAITTTATPASGVTPGFAPAARQYGTVVSVQGGTPPTLTVTLAGSTTPIAGVRYEVSYSPNANDTVICDHVGSDVIVSGALATGATGAGGGPVPVGAVVLFAKAFTDPAWLLLNGGTFSSTTYPALFTFLGSTTLPNWTDRIPIGAGTLAALGATAGASTHTMTTAEMVAHNHVDSGHSHTIPFGNTVNPDPSTNSGAWRTVGAAGSFTSLGTANLSTVGSTTPFSILNPVIGAGYYIRSL